MIGIRRGTAAVLAVVVLAIAGTAFAGPTVPGAVYSDQQAVGTNKPIVQIQQELQAAGVRDVQPTDWYAGSVTVIVQSGLLPPTQDGQFHPEAEVSAGEGIAVFAKVLGVAAKNDTPAQAAAKMQEAGLVNQGVSIDRDMSRMEFATMLGKALGIEPAPINPAECPFSDSAFLSREEMGLLKALYDLGIFKGYVNDGVRTFQPNNVLTRAELAILVDRILGAK